MCRCWPDGTATRAVLANGMTAGEVEGVAAELFKDRAEEFLKLYPGDTDEQAADSAGAYGGDCFIAFSTWKWLEAHRKTGDSPVYRYPLRTARAAQQVSIPARLPSTPTTSSTSSARWTRGRSAVWRPEDRKLSEQMMGYWTNFAKTRRSQRRGAAGVAEVRQGRLADPPGRDHHLPGRIRCGRGMSSC